MDQNTLLWTLVVFFGATVLFGAIANVTEGESDLLRIGLQAAVGLVLIGALALFLRRSRR